MDYFLHESAYVHKDARIGAGSRIWQFCCIMEGAQIGEHCNIGAYVFVEKGVKIGNGVKVKNNVSLYSGVELEEDVFVGPNVVFTNGLIARDNGEVYLYYASSDTRMHVATTTVDRLLDYVFRTPEDPHRSVECVAQRCDLIRKNLEYLKKENK